MMNLAHKFETWRTRPGWSGIIRTFGTVIIATVGVVTLLASWPSSSGTSTHPTGGAWTVPIDGQWTPRLSRWEEESYASHAELGHEVEQEPFPLDPPHWDEDDRSPGSGPIAIEDPADPNSPPPEDRRPRTREYVVKKNDSFWRIADRELGSGLRHEEILEWNPALRGKTLHAGMKILLPARPGDDLARGSDSPAPVDAPPQPRSHTVRKGENLTKIARLYDVTPEAIFASNRSRLRSIDHVTVGKTLTIPAPTGTATRSARTEETVRGAPDRQVTGRGVGGRARATRGAG